jgi:uncharacterized protein (TIGR02466 family)
MTLMPIYSTPFWRSELPDFEEQNQTFLQAVRTFKQNNPSVTKSNIAGYHSPDTLQGVPELRPLLEFICSMALQAAEDLNFIECDVFLTSAWVNFNDTRQAMNNEHIHDQTFSGVFYLSAPPESGRLVVYNPGLNRLWSGCSLVQSKNEFTGDCLRIEPQEGTVLLWPAYLPHSVETNNHDEERISISFNLIALPKGKMSFPTL